MHENAIKGVDCDAKLHDKKFPFMRYQDERDNVGKVNAGTWGQLVGLLNKRVSREAKSGGAFSPGVLKAGTTRGSGNVKHLMLAVADIDDGTPLHTLEGRIELHTYAAYSSHSHTHEYPKYRIVFPLSRPCTAEEWPSVWGGLNALLAGHCDKACKDPSRLYYLPSCPPETAGDSFFQSHEGELLDPDDLKKLAPAPVEAEASKNPFAAAVGYQPPERVEEGGRNSALIAYAGHLRGKGMPEGLILEAVKNFNKARIVPPMDDDDVEDVVSRYAKPVESESPVTLVVGNFGADRFVRTEPPKLEYMVGGLLPRGFGSGLLAAPGNAGKTFFATQMGIALATGGHLFGRFSVPTPRTVVMLTGENSEGSLHRRVISIVAALKQRGEWTDEHQERIRNFYIVPTEGFNLRLLQRVGGGALPSAKIKELIDAVAKVSPNLIILDPLSRFFGGDENTADDATLFIEQLERMRRETGAEGVICAHHVYKSAGKAAENDQFSARGSGAFVDGARWVAGLRYLTAEEKNKVPEAFRRQFIKCEVPKVNDAPAPDLFTLRRGDGGYLYAVNFDQEAKTAKDEQELAQVLRLLNRTKDSEPLGKRKFAEKYHEQLGVGRNRVEELVGIAMTAGYITQQGKPGGIQPIEVTAQGVAYFAVRG